MKNLNGIYTIWLRDLKRFLRDKPRIIGATAQPALFLLLLGTGIGVSMKDFQLNYGSNILVGIDGYLKFIFPGIVGMALLFTSIFSAISIIWDREVGFLKEVMVAPVSRWAVSIGKILGGSTVATIQATLMLLFAPIVGVHLSISQVLTLIPVYLFISISLTAMGILVASRMHSMQGFTAIMNFLVLPMFFLSGAMYPLENLPRWMDILVGLNPLTYGVDLLRGIVIGNFKYGILTDIPVIAIFGLCMISLSTYMFGKTE